MFSKHITHLMIKVSGQNNTDSSPYEKENSSIPTNGKFSRKSTNSGIPVTRGTVTEAR